MRKACRQAEIHLAAPKYGPGARNGRRKVARRQKSPRTALAGNSGFAAERELMAALCPAVCAASRTPDRRSRQSRPGGAVAGPARAACRGVGIAAGAGIVLRVGNHDRLARARCQLHRVAHALRRRVNAAVEIAFRGSRSARRWCQPRRRHPFGCGHRRIRSRRNRGNPPRGSRRERQRRHRVALQRRKLLVDPLVG